MSPVIVMEDPSAVKLSNAIFPTFVILLSLNDVAPNDTVPVASGNVIVLSDDAISATARINSYALSVPASNTRGLAPARTVPVRLSVPVTTAVDATVPVTVAALIVGLVKVGVPASVYVPVILPSRTWISIPCTVIHAGCKIQFEDKVHQSNNVTI